MFDRKKRDEEILNRVHISMVELTRDLVNLNKAVSKLNAQTDKINDIIFERNDSILARVTQCERQNAIQEAEREKTDSRIWQLVIGFACVMLPVIYLQIQDRKPTPNNLPPTPPNISQAINFR